MTIETRGLENPVRAGDILLRDLKFEGVGHSAVIVSERPETAQSISARGVPVESTAPGAYVEVLETPFGGGKARSIGRRLTDSSGRLLRGQSIRPGEARESAPIPAFDTASFDAGPYDAGPYDESLEDFRRELTAALHAGPAGFGRVVALARGELPAGAAQAFTAVMAGNPRGAVDVLMGGGASLATGQAGHPPQAVTNEAFATLAANGAGLLAGLLASADLSQIPVVARLLLNQAGSVTQILGQTPWSRALGSQVTPGAGTAALGTALTVLVSRLNVGRGLPGHSLFEELLSPLRYITPALSPPGLPIPFGLTVQLERVQRLLVELVRYADQDDVAERTLLRMIQEHPHLGPVVLAGAVVEGLLRHAAPWLKFIGMDLSDQSSRGRLNVHELPAPNTRQRMANSSGEYRVKYLIVSDVHRDARADQDFSGGSLAHFNDNQALYLRLLDWVKGADRLESNAERHILIENGDVEEFWAVPELAQAPAQRLAAVIQQHRAVYDRLVELKAQGRYYRTVGNHDGPLRDPAVFRGLPTADRGTEPGNWDFLIIPGVKTMDDLNPLDLFFGRRHIQDFIGLDPSRYERKKCLMVCHGHQFDFWNAPENELIGKIVTAIFRYPDAWMDPILAIGGIQSQGLPLVDFSDVLAHPSNFVTNSWPAQQPALARAHAVQHLSPFDRLLKDGFLYQESLAAGIASLTMPLGRCGGTPNRTVGERLGHQLLIGHTHYPQSQPFVALGDAILRVPGVREAADAELAPLALIANGLGPAISDDGGGMSGSDILKGWLNRAVKSRYFNSGVTGWHQGVIYAIEITTDGQARLLYLADNMRVPQAMDWELAPLTAEQQRQFQRALATTRQAVQRVESRIRTAVQRFLDRLHGGFERALGAFRNGFEGLLNSALSGAQALPSILGTGFTMLSGEHAAETLQVGMVEFVARISRYVTGAASGQGGDLPVFRFELPFSPAHLQNVETLRQQLESGGLVPPEHARHGGGYHLALAWHYAQQHAPYAGRPHETDATCGARRSEAHGAESPHRATGALLAWLPMHSRVGPPNLSPPLALRTSIARNGTTNNLRFALELTRDLPPTPHPPPPPRSGGPQLVS